MKPAEPPTVGDAERPGRSRAETARRRTIVQLGALVLIALTLRAPLIAIAPVTDQVRSGLHIDAATAGLFTSIPVLLFSLSAPPALLLLVKAGLDRTLLLAVIGIAVGVLVRSVGGLPVALVGTAILGVAIGIGNVTVPVTIGRDFPTRAGPITGVYTAALNAGAMMASLLTAPLADVVGWRWALACWASLGLFAGLAWTSASRERHRHPSTQAKSAAAASDSTAPDATEPHSTAPDATEPHSTAPDATKPHAAAPDATEPDSTAPDATGADAHVVSASVETSASAWRRPAALLLALAFGCQAFGYYGVTAWLPTLLADERGLSRAAAGVSSSLFQIMGIIGAIVVPLVIRSGLGHRAVMLGICTSWIVLPLGLAGAPALWWLWCCFGGLAQGGGFTIIFTIVLRQARGIVDRQRLSTLVQGVGYAIGACGPTVVGAVHQATGSWNAPMFVVAFGLAVMALAGTTAATLSPPVPAAV